MYCFIDISKVLSDSTYNFVVYPAFNFLEGKGFAIGSSLPQAQVSEGLNQLFELSRQGGLEASGESPTLTEHLCMLKLLGIHVQPML